MAKSYYFDEATQEWVPLVQGLVGPQGPPGPKGDRGDPGTPGEDGKQLALHTASIHMMPFIGVSTPWISLMPAIATGIAPGGGGDSTMMTGAPISIPQSVTIDALALQITSVTAQGKMWAAIYNTDANGRPTTIVATTSQIDIHSFFRSGTYTFDIPETIIEPGNYFIVGYTSRADTNIQYRGWRYPDYYLGGSRGSATDPFFVSSTPGVLTCTTQVSNVPPSSLVGTVWDPLTYARTALVPFLQMRAVRPQ